MKGGNPCHNRHPCLWCGATADDGCNSVTIADSSIFVVFFHRNQEVAMATMIDVLHWSLVLVCVPLVAPQSASDYCKLSTHLQNIWVCVCLLFICLFVCLFD